MPPSIDGNESPGTSQGQGAGAGCNGSTTAAITAERMAENSLKGMKLGLRKCSLLSTHFLALVFVRYSYGELTSIFKQHFWIQRLSTCCSSLNAVQSRKLSSLNQSNESVLSNEDFKLMDIDIAGR
eukprot:scaffold2484_cov75-Skeletonema_menzelii.AAC.1